MKDNTEGCKKINKVRDTPRMYENVTIRKNGKYSLLGTTCVPAQLPPGPPLFCPSPRLDRISDFKAIITFP